MMAICAVEEKSNFFVECAAGEPEKSDAFIERRERCRRDAKDGRIVPVSEMSQ
jgi:hypothetical protein